MFAFPMLAFKIDGSSDEYINMTIDEILGFPNALSYGGGYGAKGILNIRTGAYFVSAIHYFTTGELYRFSLELEKCYRRLNGIAILENVDRELELKCEFNKLGHVIVSGNFQADSSVNNILHFEIKTDQTQIKDTMSNLRTVYELFGNERGIL